MFQSETEDMLPRCAPKPTALGVNEAIVKPTVPDVSIIFNQDTPPSSMQSASLATQHQQSYANWKKQSLPKVSYPPSLDIMTATQHEYTTSTRSNVYPMRNALAAQAQSPLTLHSTNTESMQQYRRTSLEVTPKSLYSTDGAASTMAACNPTYTLVNQPRRCLETVPQQVYHQQARILHSPSDVLTICAGTQTTPTSQFNSQGLPDIATKQDIDMIMKTLHEIRLEQLRLADVCHALLGQQKQTPVLRDTATQCDGTGLIVGVIPQKRPPPIIYDYIEEDSAEGANGTYRNSPSGHSNNKPQSNVVPVLPKPTTEKSMVMNELALKYLPNDKLSELLQELRMSPTTTNKFSAHTGGHKQQLNEDEDYHHTTTAIATPLKRIEYLDKGPNDISNASYKYLKKYRLLPEDHAGANEVANSSRQPPPPLQVPYQKQNDLKQSPLVLGQQRTATHQQENMLDLDAIRRQPKFL